jgi:adenylate cyclase
VNAGQLTGRSGERSGAVRCAIEVQSGPVERNAGVPEDRRIEFRVGIHLGDVVEESDGDLMGDGVNIAARLEGIANPGAICLSEDAYRDLEPYVDLVLVVGGEKLDLPAEHGPAEILDRHAPGGCVTELLLPNRGRALPPAVHP